MTSTLTLLSPAKLNLFLHITGRRPDGYHELQTVFQLLDWGDSLYFSSNNSGEVTVEMSGANILIEDNLIWRAAQTLHSDGLGAHIRVNKQIPTGGGLGGGSSNAATTLLALNHLWRRELSSLELQSIGTKLGADVPVFVAGHSAWAEGVGDILKPLELPAHWFIILAPRCHVTTEKIFSNSQLTRGTSPIKLAAFFEGSTRNDCQDVVRNLYPEVDKALNWLGNFGEARLTGTGACIFARFQSKAEADAVLRQMPEQWAGFIAQGINKSPVHSVLF